ncbi:MAG: hypothetical protein ACPG77_09130 [Nannocystaceae bacterium]
MVGLLAGLLVVMTPVEANAGKRRDREKNLKSEGLDNPRERQLPRRHRFRLALQLDYIRLSSACDANQNCTQFHYAPLTLDFAYQLQFFKYVMLRPALGVGLNIANSRNAMFGVFKPSLFSGYQGKILGVAFGYAYTLVFPPFANSTDGRGGQIQPLLWNNHIVAGEISATSRIHDTAIMVGLRVGGQKSRLIHGMIDKKRWYPHLSLTLGWFFDGTKRRRKKRQRAAAG